MQHTFGTDHVTADQFHALFRALAPGESFIYAVGDLSLSRQFDKEKGLDKVADTAWKMSDGGFACLTQRACHDLYYRNGGGRAFEYIITKCDTQKKNPKPSLTSNSLRHFQRAEERELA